LLGTDKEIFVQMYIGEEGMLIGKIALFFFIILNKKSQELILT